MKIIKTIGLTVLTLALLFQPSALQAANGRPVNLTFEKCALPDGSLAGSVTGNCGAGTIAFNYIAVVPGKAIWHFSGEYVITTTPDCSFTAVCSGTVDTRNGKVVLNGVVTEGAYFGAQVKVRARANSTLTCSSGTMRLTPADCD